MNWTVVPHIRVCAPSAGAVLADQEARLDGVEETFRSESGVSDEVLTGMDAVAASLRGGEGFAVCTCGVDSGLLG